MMGIPTDITLKTSLLFWFCIYECECTCVTVETFLFLFIQFFLNVTSLHLFEKSASWQKLQGDVLFVTLPDHLPTKVQSLESSLYRSI